MIAQFKLYFYILLRIGLLYAFCFICSNAHGQQQPKQQFYNAGLFLKIKNISADKRVDSAGRIYKANCRKLSEADAMRSLNDLFTIAQSLNDLPLECSVYDMRSDYYSVNRGFNELSTKYFDDAILFAKEHNLLVETGLYMHRKAIYYFIYKHNIDALKYFLLAQDKFREAGFKNVPQISTFLNQFAGFYYSLSDYQNARAYLNYSLQNKPANPRDITDALNTIALSYRNSGNYKPALKYFNASLKQAKASKDSAYIAIVLGNIGSVFFLQGDYQKALPLIKTDYEQSLKFDQKLNAAIALLRLIRINIDTRQFEQALIQLDDEDKLLANVGENALAYRGQYYELKALVNEKIGRSDEAVKFRKIYEQVKDSVAKRDNIAAVERVRLNWEMDKSRAEINKIKIHAEIRSYKQITIIIVLGLLIIITVLIYNRQRLKTKKDRELFASEKRRVDEELANATQALQGYTENLTQKNLLIEEFKSEVERLQIKFDDADGAHILNKMMEAHIMTDENWSEFKKLFSKANPTFLYNVRNRFDHLTGTDVRLLALLKLRLNNREIAGMLGITTDGVKKAKQRLRRKMNLVADADLDEILANL